MPTMARSGKKKLDTVQALADEVQAYCKKNADPAKADKWARYFKEGYDSWGLLDKEHPLWHEKRDEWANRYSDIGTAGFLELGNLLFVSGKYEEGSIAINLLKDHAGELNTRSVQKLGGWFKAGIRNWAHTDVLCGFVIEPLLNAGRIKPSALAKWRDSKYKYQRRAVPVSLLGLVKLGDDPAPLLEFIRPLMMDEERVVGQGLGWFLREAWKKNPKPVEKFLLEYKDDAQRVIFQYATEKMPKKDRERFRKAKKR
jgi:3-methyladenine DNA glycosylase AlkD